MLKKTVLSFLCVCFTVLALTPVLFLKVWTEETGGTVHGIAQESQT